MPNVGAYCYIETKSGAKAGAVLNQHYIIGTTNTDDGYNAAGSGCNIFAVVATATSVVVGLGGMGDDYIYVYR